MKAVTAYEMGMLEKRAIEEYKIPGLLLMENAAIGFLRELETHVGAAQSKRVMIFCGKGNNGGDGFAIARHLHNRGADVRIVLLADPDALKADARMNFEIARAMEIPIYQFTDERDRPRLFARLELADLVVDALFGTGFHGSLEGAAAEAVRAINESGKFVAAVDIVSGAESDTGRIDGECVAADVTVTFALPKIGHLVYPARGKSGTVVVSPISIPREVIETFEASSFVLEEEYARMALPERAQDSHKGSFGKVFVLAGSRGMAGAAEMCARSVLAAGAGMATVGVPAGLADVMATKLTEVMTCPLPELEGMLSKSALPTVQERLETNDVLLMGCGLGRSASVSSVVHKLIPYCTRPMVIDADALIALQGNLPLLSQRRADVVLTPHPAEFARMTGVELEVVMQNRVDIARKFALDFKVSLVLKGADTVVAHPDGTVYCNTSGNSGMATAGSGDVLAGLIAGLAAQGLPIREAANLGVYLHGVAGDCAAEKYGEYSMTAGNILECIRDAFFSILEGGAQYEDTLE